MSVATSISALLCLTLAAALGRAQGPPAAEVQQSVLRTVTEFAHDYQERIPNFTCVRTTQHLYAPSATKQWRTEAKTAYELSYYEHEEHYRLLMVDDIPSKKVPTRSKAEGWVEMNGNFGWILKQLFDPKVHPHFQWHGWDDVHGKRAMVFSYRVALAESQAVSTTCSSWLIFDRCKELNYAFHGLLFVDAESRDILRIADIPEGLPASYIQGNTSVDFGRVTVAGSDYLLPIADQIETFSGKILFRNDSTYTDYRRFASESTMKTEGIVP
jgi:hypothetical protein